MNDKVKKWLLLNKCIFMSLVNNRAYMGTYKPLLNRIINDLL